MLLFLLLSIILPVSHAKDVEKECVKKCQNQALNPKQYRYCKYQCKHPQKKATIQTGIGKPSARTYNQD